MPNTNLIIAIVFAAVFGTALIWLVLYLLHRYIHQQCLDLDHWFHTTLSHHISFSPCEHGDEESRSKSRSRSARRERSRGRSRHDNARRHYRSRDRERHTERSMERNWLGMVPMMPMNMPMPIQPQQWAQPYYPPIGWHGQTPISGQPTYQMPMHYPQLPEQAAQVPFDAMPVAMPPRDIPQMAIPTPRPAFHQRQQLYSETSSDVFPESQSEMPSQNLKPAPKPVRRVNGVDYIHICDEYPPVVLEGLKKTTREPSPSPSSSSSDVSGTTEEIPRDSIPRAKLHFADDSPLRSPQYPQSAARAWNERTLSPRQWMNHG